MSVIIKGKNRDKPHTVRYWADGRQRERSFTTPGEARDFKIKVDYDTRAKIFTDDRAGRELFGPAAEKWLASRPLAPSSSAAYRAVYRTHVGPVLAKRTLQQVADDRDAVVALLTKDMAALSHTRRTKARLIICGTLDEAVRSGKLARHRCAGIELRDDGPGERDDFVFPSYGQVCRLAGALRHGLAVWIMRGAGLRVAEALAVRKEDFRDGGAVLRVARQATRDGRGTMPLKSRKAGEFRDVPCPRWLFELVKDLPPGPLFADDAGKLPRYTVLNESFARYARNAAIRAGFTSHSLRHAFVSALLAGGTPITDVARWCGHRDIATTFRVYSHLIPSASDRAVSALDAEYVAWAAGDAADQRGSA
jgi:integrase